MNTNEFPELRSFFNEKEQIIAMPAKRKKTAFGGLLSFR